MKSVIHPFVWDAHYTTHLHEVDKQHHHLVDLINALAGQASSGLAVPRANVEQLFKELAAYAQYHFTEEEGLMARHHLDPRHIRYHQGEHRQFVEDVQHLYKTTLADIENEIGSLLNYLTYWLAYHILGVDQNMAAQVHRVEKGESPASAYERESEELDSSDQAPAQGPQWTVQGGHPPEQETYRHEPLAGDTGAGTHPRTAGGHAAPGDGPGEDTQAQ